MKGWRPFEEARGFVRSLKLKNFTEWIEYCKFGKDGIPKPNDIPDAPGRFYKKNNGWKDWVDWLRIQGKEWRPFEEARDFTRSLQLKNTREWEEYRNSGKKPDDIPSHPNVIYKNDWISWSDWLAL